MSAPYTTPISSTSLALVGVPTEAVVIQIDHSTTTFVLPRTASPQEGIHEGRVGPPPSMAQPTHRQAGPSSCCEVRSPWVGGLTKEWTSGQQWLRLHGYVFLCMKERDEIVDSSGYLKARSLSEKLLPRRRRRTSDNYGLHAHSASLHKTSHTSRLN